MLLSAYRLVYKAWKIFWLKRIKVYIGGEGKFTEPAEIVEVVYFILSYTPSEPLPEKRASFMEISKKASFDVPPQQICSPSITFSPRMFLRSLLTESLHLVLLLMQDA